MVEGKLGSLDLDLVAVCGACAEAETIVANTVITRQRGRTPHVRRCRGEFPRLEQRMQAVMRSFDSAHRSLRARSAPLRMTILTFLKSPTAWKTVLRLS